MSSDLHEVEESRGLHECRHHNEPQGYHFLVRHIKTPFFPVIMHTMQEQEGKTLEATPLFVFLSLVDSPFSVTARSQSDLSSLAKRHV